MREQARRDIRPPLLDSASDEPLMIAFTDTSLRDILCGSVQQGLAAVSVQTEACVLHLVSQRRAFCLA